MSRIYEALQRAADRQATSGLAPDPSLPRSIDQDTLGPAEPYSVEASEGERLRATPPAMPIVVTPVAERPVGLPVNDLPSSSVLDHMSALLSEKVVLDQKMSPGSREQYRRLAAFLHDAQATNGLRVLMIGSAVAGEGKTLTAANLALTLSESYRKRVLLIDADLRRPTLHTVFRVNTAGGLTEGLEAGSPSRLVVRQVSQRLAVLPAGRPTSDPMAALISERMRRLIDEARDMYDWVIVDTPPLVLLPDANLLSAMADGMVLVIRAESTPHELVRRAVEAVGRKRIVGVLLNHAKAGAHNDYSGYDEYYFRASAEIKRSV